MKAKPFSVLITSMFMILILGGCANKISATDGDLVLKEHQLMEKPSIIPLTFQPIEGSQDEVLAINEAERVKILTNEVFTIEGHPAMNALGENKNLQAVVYTASEGQPLQTVKVMRDSETIFEAPAGLPSPAVPIQALWTYDGHWTLEVLYSDETTWAGRVFIDGVMVNEQKGYEEAFGLQLLDGKPFFFYKRDGKIGYSYDGNETILGYNEIPHYFCCAETEYNPIQAENMVAFFAQKDNTWYYVELGKIKK